MKNPFVKVQDTDGGVSWINMDKVTEMWTTIVDGEKVTAIDMEGYSETRHFATNVSEILDNIWVNN